MGRLTYNRIRLNMVSPWNLYGETQTQWSCFFNLSGAAPLTAAAIEPTALDLYAPIASLSTTGTWLEGWSYYPPESKVPAATGTYTSSQHPATGVAYNAPTLFQQLEVVVLCEANVGINSRGKPVYLRKFIHNVVADTADHNAHAPIGPTDWLAKWKNGAGPNLLVPVAPDDGAAGTNWQIKPHLFTHQLRKGHKRKVVTKTEYVPIPIP